MPSVQKITPFLWFDHEAEEAARFYTSVFKDSKITAITHYGDSGAGPKGKVMTVSFELAGQKFVALNGGPTFKFTEAISLVINCENQAEVDYFWTKLCTDGGREVECGWVKDKYGLSWQVTPIRMYELMQDPDPGKKDRAMRAMMTMKKLDIATIEAAALQKS